LKIGRFKNGSSTFYGIVEGREVVPLKENPFCALVESGHRLPLEGLQVLAPCLPTKAVCVGLNYRDHAEEMGLTIPNEPVIFIKPPTTILDPGGDIIYPSCSRQVDFEAELAVVIGRTCRHVSPLEAGDYIFGYTCSNDVTARDLQKRDGQWTRAKSFDTFLPLGPYIVTGIEPGNLSITLRQNGIIRQHSSTSKLIFSVHELVSFISNVMTLNPGDIILTGTPAGVGPLAVGDKIEVEIEGVGKLINGVALPQ